MQSLSFSIAHALPETILAIEEALSFHNAIGGARKEARLRALTEYWVRGVKDVPGIRFHTAMGKQLSCGITCTEIEGISATALRNWLMDQHRILTMDVTRRTKEFAGVRISPGLSTTKAELDRLVGALAEARGAISKNG